tara:strand:- start:6579 stop:7016 length:438 start_codon:yes stop_codon:yes gene_type:complete
MEVEGLEEAINGYRELAQATQWKILSQATAAAGRKIAKRAKRNAPVGSVAKMAYDNSMLLAAGYGRTTVKAVRFRRRYDNVALVGIGPNKFAYYLSSFVEKGHAVRGGGFKPADPWLKPAISQTEKEAVQAFERKILLSVNKVLK